MAVAVGMSATYVLQDAGPPSDKADVVWQVDLGLFSAMLTAVTIVFAVTITPQTRWPSFGDLMRAMAALSWLATATVGIMCAAAGDIWSHSGLAAAGAVLTVVQLGFGLDSLWVLMRFRSAAGRRKILVRLTSRRLHRAADAGLPSVEHHELADLNDEIEYSIDRSDVAEIAARVSEIVDGCQDDKTADQARHRLALLTHLTERLGRSVLFESLTGDAARVAMPPLVRGVLQTSWRLSELTFPNRETAERDEAAAAVALGQVCRVIAWLQQCAQERLQTDPNDPASRQIGIALSQGRQQIVLFVDPDPPGFFRAESDPWPYGFSDPRAVLLWLSALCEFGGSHAGVGLYILCEVLTGEKFFGNYWDDACVFTEIERRIGRDGERSTTAGGLVSACGGLGTVSLDLAATVIAGLRNRNFVPPAGWESDASYSTDKRYLRSQLTMFATYDCLPDEHAALDWVAEALLSAPTRRCVENVVRDAYVQHAEPSRIPRRSLGERPGAVVLAALVRLAMHRPAQAEAFVGRLPAPLLGGALQQARFSLRASTPAEPVASMWTVSARRLLPPRPEQERELLSIVGEVLARD
ncbi:hypothetical protein [Dactylosporangium siamense]|uniref:hypothetical protein n=1 Tax=Dactylosporangium siamense TaxID=685454 RepID=UPI0031E91BE9